MSFNRKIAITFDYCKLYVLDNFLDEICFFKLLNRAAKFTHKATFNLSIYAPESVLCPSALVISPQQFFPNRTWLISTAKIRLLVYAQLTCFMLRPGYRNDCFCDKNLKKIRRTKFGHAKLFIPIKLQRLTLKRPRSRAASWQVSSQCIEGVAIKIRRACNRFRVSQLTPH